MEQTNRTIKSHLFDTWKDIPSIDHLLEVKDNHIYDFSQHKCKGVVSFVAYVIDKEKVVAFGSATYFSGKDNYYVDYDDDNYTKEQQNCWKLWVEGLVSIKKGCGSIVLRELEKWMESVSKEYNIERKVINIISVYDSIGFYEENGYVNCYTGPRFAGTDNTRMAKSVPNSGFDITEDVQLCPFIVYPTKKSSIECLEWDIARYVSGGRRIPLAPYIVVPKDIPRKEYFNYVARNKWNEYVTQEMKMRIFYIIDEMDS